MSLLQLIKFLDFYHNIIDDKVRRKADLSYSLNKITLEFFPMSPISDPMQPQVAYVATAHMELFAT